MAFLLGPESARARWAKKLPSDVRIGLPDVTKYAVAMPGQIAAWEVDGADLLLIGGKPIVRTIQESAGAIFARSKAEAKGVKWKRRTGTILPVTEPMSIFSDDLSNPTPVVMDRGTYDVFFSTDGFVRVKLAKKKS